MKLYDISQELITSDVYPGDPVPTVTKLSSISNGDLYNLTHFSACAHNGTHVDAPCHFIENGKTVGEMNLSKMVGEAYVAEAFGDIGKNEANDMLNKARQHSIEASMRILIKGDSTVTKEAAKAFYLGGVSLLGVESQSVGPINAPMEVHKLLLGQEVVLLEGLRLGEVSEGAYFLFAAPINIGESDGAPCRAVLVDFNG